MVLTLHRRYVTRKKGIIPQDKLGKEHRHVETEIFLGANGDIARRVFSRSGGLQVAALRLPLMKRRTGQFAPQFFAEAKEALIFSALFWHGHASPAVLLEVATTSVRIESHKSNQPITERVNVRKGKQTTKTRPNHQQRHCLCPILLYRCAHLLDDDLLEREEAVDGVSVVGVVGDHLADLHVGPAT